MPGFRGRNPPQGRVPLFLTLTSFGTPSLPRSWSSEEKESNLLPSFFGLRAIPKCPTRKVTFFNPRPNYQPGIDHFICLRSKGGACRPLASSLRITFVPSLGGEMCFKARTSLGRGGSRRKKEKGGMRKRDIFPNPSVRLNKILLQERDHFYTGLSERPARPL